MSHFQQPQIDKSGIEKRHSVEPVLQSFCAVVQFDLCLLKPILDFLVRVESRRTVGTLKLKVYRPYCKCVRVQCHNSSRCGFFVATRRTFIVCFFFFFFFCWVNCGCWIQKCSGAFHEDAECTLCRSGERPDKVDAMHVVVFRLTAAKGWGTPVSHLRKNVTWSHRRCVGVWALLLLFLACVF